jgi:hypothetical protein
VAVLVVAAEVVKQVEPAAQAAVVDVVLELQATDHQHRPAVDLVIVEAVAEQVLAVIKEQAVVAEPEQWAVIDQVAPVVPEV